MCRCSLQITGVKVIATAIVVQKLAPAMQTSWPVGPILNLNMTQTSFLQ